MVGIQETASAFQDALLTMASEYPLRQLIDALPAAVYTTDSDGRVELYNRAAVALWGREPDRSDERWCGSWRLYYPDGTPMRHDECPMARAIKSGQPIRGEEAMAERPNGTRVNFLAYPTPLYTAQGTPLGALNMMLDITDRKEAESALRRREAELTDFVENTTIGLHWVGPDGKILWANRAEMDLLGFTRDEYIGRHIADFHVDGAVIDDILSRLTCHETLKDYEARLRCKDGSIKHVLIDSSVYSEDGRFVHTRCYTRDVTAQKLMEARLTIEAAIAHILAEANSVDQAATGVLRMLSEHFEADIAELWLGDEELRCAALYSSLTGKSLQKFKTVTRECAFGPAKGLPGRVWESKSPIWWENVSQVPEFSRAKAAADLGLGSGVGIPILCGQQCLGVIVCFMQRAAPSDPSLLGMMGSIGHKLGQFADRTRGAEENRFLAAVVKASTDAIICATVDGEITSWNDGAERLLGYTPEEALGQPVSLVMPKNKAFERPRYVAKLKSGQIAEPFETTRLHKSGVAIPVSISLSGIFGAGGDIIGTAAIVRDISERKAADAQLSGRIRQLQAVSELGLRALVSDDLQSLFDQAVALLAKGLGVEFAKVLQLQADERELVIRSGVGWPEELIGRAAVGTGHDSQAGYTLSVDKPVLVENTAAETRFRHSKLLHSQGIVSGLSVVIRRGGQRPFGVLAAHAKSPRRFSAHDVHFIQSIANVLATTLQRKSYEERQVTLIRELAHRVKNTLAVIQSIARQTGAQATTIQDFIGSFEGRLFALAQAHDLLTASNWGGASLAKLVGLVIGGHAGKDRLHIDIEDIRLSSTGTQAMVMVFHELMTNAAKYGAHSNDKGKIMLEGRREGDGDDLVYALTWRETGGPPVTKPTRRGFGSELVTATIQMQCGGELTVDWRPDGLVVDCKLPLSSIVEAQVTSRNPLQIKRPA